MKKVFILCHNVQRDRQFDSMLQYELSKNNQVWLNKLLSNDRYNICLLKPDVIVLPEIRNEYTLELAKRVKEWGGQVVVRHGELGITEESITSHFDESYKKAIFGNVDFNKYVDLVLVFGKTQAEQMVKYRGVDPDKIKPIGNPILDPYFTPQEPGERPEGKQILFAAGFPYADRNHQYCMPEAPIGAGIHKYFKELCLRKRAEWIELMRWFIETYPDWNVSVRPHSGERPQVYTTIFKDKVKCIAGPPSRISLRFNDAVVHAGSTCAFELHLMDIPAIIYKPITHDVLLKGLHPLCNSVKEFKECFDSLELGKSNINKDLYSIFEKNYIGPVDGKVHKRAAEYINSLPPIEKNVIPGDWPPIKEPMKNIDPDISFHTEGWSCGGCGNRYFVLNHREMVKCPFCGIANIRVQGNVQPKVNSVPDTGQGAKHGPVEKKST